MHKNTKKIVVISAIIGIVLFSVAGIILFVLLSGNGNSRWELRMMLNSDRYSYEEKKYYAQQYLHGFAMEIDSELHLMEYKWDTEDDKWDYRENGLKWDISGIKLPSDIRIEYVCEDDIGNDGVMDMVIVYSLYVKKGINDYDTYESSRIICVYRQNSDGTYDFWQENRTLLSDYYGTNKDYSIFVLDGELCFGIENYFIHFDICDEKLLMTGAVTGGGNNYNEDRTYAYWYYEEGVKVTVSYISGEEEIISEEPFEPIFILFEDAEGIVFPGS